MKNQLRTVTWITLTILVILIIAGCKANKQPNQNIATDNDIAAISNRTWELTKLEGKVIDQTSTKGEKIHFRLNDAENTVRGYSGCNIFNGSYTLEKRNRIRFSQLASTKMACPGAVVSESDFLTVFGLTDNYTVNDGILMLNVGRRAPLAVFKEITKEEQIVEKYWKLKTLDGQEVKMAKNQEREIYFILKTEENRVMGFAGCNTFNGGYSLEEGSRISFSNMAATLKACPDVDVNESDFLEVFELTNNYTIDGEILSLNVGRRAPLAVFEAVYFD